MRGEVKLAAADRDVFRPGLKLRLKLANGDERSSVVDAARRHKSVIVVRLRGVDGAEVARSLHGASALAARRDLPKLPANAYREADLVGMQVIDATLGVLGEVRKIRHYPSCDMLIVGEKQLLVPMLRAYGLQVDVAAREIRVQLPAGFGELM